MRFIIGWAVALAIGVPVAIHVRDTMHIGAPPLAYHCPVGSYVVRHWAPGPATGPGEVEYYGQHQWASCASSVDVGGDASTR